MAIERPNKYRVSAQNSANNVENVGNLRKIRTRKLIFVGIIDNIKINNINMCLRVCFLHVRCGLTLIFCDFAKPRKDFSAIFFSQLCISSKARHSSFSLFNKYLITHIFYQNIAPSFFR